MPSIEYRRRAEPPVVIVTADDGTSRTWPLAEFEANPQACVLATGNMMEAERAAMLRRLASRRWEATQRFTYDGVLTQADPAIAVITAAVVGRQAFGITAPQAWKLADGEFRQFDTPALLAFGAAVQAHIQACFDREAALTAAIVAAETPEALAAINIEQGWP